VSSGAIASGLYLLFDCALLIWRWVNGPLYVGEDVVNVCPDEILVRVPAASPEFWR